MPGINTAGSYGGLIAAGNLESVWSDRRLGMMLSRKLKGLPMPQCTVMRQPVDRQVGALIRIFRRQRFVDIDAVPRRFPSVQETVPEYVIVRENGIGGFGV